MNLSEMMTFVRDHADTDETDAPTSNLTVYARAAFNDIRRRTPVWPQQESSVTLTTSAGVGGYAFSSMDPATLELPSAVVGELDNLDYISWTNYLDLEGGSNLSFDTADAQYWTVRNDTLYLWPTPSGVKTYTVYGFGQFDTWPSGSNEPPLPREFDEAICWYMLAKYHLAQEDLDLSNHYLREYETLVGRFVAAQMREDRHGPKILGGRLRHRIGYAEWVRRNTEG